ncbi:hypothetical protein NDU88_008584 [Pleurodeles waltl]|uniref:Uncharacterized protein n=1 Tax=Pleurodeles waltl TaxID=8319 RepID=A0AAV7NZP3_PLEWA|nr:hypothetical protein NDU88_008584 [Pleurodeles waltl]
MRIVLIQGPGGGGRHEWGRKRLLPSLEIGKRKENTPGCLTSKWRVPLSRRNEEWVRPEESARCDGLYEPRPVPAAGRTTLEADLALCLVAIFLLPPVSTTTRAEEMEEDPTSPRPNSTKEMQSRALLTWLSNRATASSWDSWRRDKSRRCGEGAPL